MQARKAGHVYAYTSTPAYFIGGARMEIEAITNLISNMGFPIACVIALFLDLNKEREEHKVETQKLADAINNNTIVMEKILSKVGDDTDD